MAEEKGTIKNVCVFCGASVGNSPGYSEGALKLAQVLAQNGIGLVYGGGNVGLMGIIAKEVERLGGEVTGVIPQSIKEFEQVGSSGFAGKEIVVDSMHERKMIMAREADAFIAMPGGFGTLEELFEVTTWHQLGMHQKPIGVLNINHFYDHLRTFVDFSTSQGFIRPESKEIMIFDSDPETLVQKLKDFQPSKSRIRYLASEKET